MSIPSSGSERIKSIVRVNAERHGLRGARLYVARSPGGGWRVRVVHDGVAELPEHRRRELLLAGIADDISEAQIITQEEEQWYGPPFPEVDGPLPVWPEILEQLGESGLLFASDLDEDLTRPAVVTFYSLRGGVGRTTALAAAARILASRGRRVVAIDMDFEAPGLPYVFGLPEPEAQVGAVHILLALERGDEVDVRDHMQRASEVEELYCIPAGQLGPEYAQRLQLIEPDIWYREAPNPLHLFVDRVAASTVKPDFILLDARTGISPISAPLLFDVADLAVVCFYPHPQARRGTELIVRSLLAARSRRFTDRPVSPEPRFLVSPVPAGPSASYVRERALSWIEEWLQEVSHRRPSDLGQLQADELTHFVRYSAETAFSDSLLLTPNNVDTYGPVADWIEQLLPKERGPETIPHTQRSKLDVLRGFEFSTGTAEDQDSLVQDFVKTDVFASALSKEYPLVLGRKGTGKTAIFRWLLDQPEEPSPVPVTSPPAFRERLPWVLSSAGFAMIEECLTSHGSRDWPTFWTCYTALAAWYSGAVPKVPPPEELGLRLDSAKLDELHVVELLRGMLRNPDVRLLTNRWLRAIDSKIHGFRFLLFDGLDTGFGNDSESRRRRSDAVTGLFTFLTETDASLPHLPFKILLRYDIWQALRFENKSHLFGRSLRLQWRNQADYFRTVLKQAVRNRGFAEMLLSRGIGGDADSWSESDVFRAWNLLVGERMKGGKTTFTRNWVWNRLADGNGDHSPRALSQLLHEATKWEITEEERSPYDRSLIRPRALVPSLETVSSQAFEALNEEFPEMKELTRTLRSIGRTPLERSDVADVNPDLVGVLELALEIGLLAVHEGTHEDVRRYRVPDLYRHALGVTRKGQA